MSSTARAPEPQAEPSDSADSRVIVVTGSTLPASVAGSIAARYPTTQVVSLGEFVAPSATASTIVIFAAEDLAEAWQLASSTTGVAALRLAFRTATATDLSAITGYALDTIQPTGDAVIVTLRPGEIDPQAGLWLSRLTGALAPVAKSAVANSAAAATRSKAARQPKARADRRRSVIGLLRRHRVAVAAAAAASLAVAVLTGLAFGSVWVGIILGGFTLLGLAQLAVAALSYRAATAARIQAQAAARSTEGLQQSLVEQVRQLTASSAETALLMREHTRDSTAAKPRD